jgi:hypothetical protein
VKKFTAAFIKWVIHYNILIKTLAVGLEDNHHVFEGQTDFETHYNCNVMATLNSAVSHGKKLWRMFW